MAISKTDLEILRALTAAREQHEELADLLDFYHNLCEVQFEAKARFSETEMRDELAMLWRLEGGIPQLTFDQLRLEPQTFAELVSQVTKVLVHHNPTWESGPEVWSPDELVALARDVFETWDTLTALRSGTERNKGAEAKLEHVSGLAVGFALAPYLQQASEVLLSHLDLRIWVQGYCPVCGGRPNFALLEQEKGARQLMCSRCNSLWPYARVGCPFCRSKERQTYYSSEDQVYRLYVCPDCKRYLKTMDLREVYRNVCPVVERLLTVGMDLAAYQEGYAE